MSVSAPPVPRIVPVRRVLEIASAGEHGGIEYREVLRFAVYVGEEPVGELESKSRAESFVAGWERHRTYTLALVEAAIGVAP